MSNKKSWANMYDVDTLAEFQKTCAEYGLKSNAVLEALMKLFSSGKCKVVIDENGINIEMNNDN